MRAPTGNERVSSTHLEVRIPRGEQRRGFRTHKAASTTEVDRVDGGWGTLARLPRIAR